MRRFDYSFLNNGLLPANLVNLTSSIASLKTMAGVRKEEFARVFTELEAVAKIQSIKSSNAIEGIVTSDERIAAIVNQNSAPLNHNEAEIAGYRDALNAIHTDHAHMDFRQRDILRLHEMLMAIAGYFPFIENFLSTLYMCYKELDKRFAVVHGKKITKKARIEATVLNSLTPLSKAEICHILPDVSPTTVEAVLGAMVKDGSIKRIGSARASRYIKA